jgi:tetratricopeptide (TPR) repeat protein
MRSGFWGRLLRAGLADAVGLVFLEALLLDYLRPSLLLLPTLPAGGDFVCHYPTAAAFTGSLLPDLRIHGWYPGAYLGHPLLLYYFPLPFLLMAALQPLLGLPAAFKVTTALGVFLVPLLAYAALRLLDLPFPAPLLGAAGGLVFVLLEENPIWGGTMASTFAGEFAYTFGTGLALLFLGSVFRAWRRGDGPWAPAVILALTGLAHGYAVLWAGLCASYLLYPSRRPVRAAAWLAAIAAVAFGLIAFWLLPLLADWGWTTPFNDPWITIELKNLLPPLLWPFFALAGLASVVALVSALRGREAEHRLLFLLHAAFFGAALAAAGPTLGIIDVRFLPFAQLALVLAGAAGLGLLVARTASRVLVALALVIVAALWADSHSTYLRYWAEYNYAGLEAKELWPAFRALTQRLRGGGNDPRVAVEYHKEHEKAGSIRMYETLPYFTGRPTLEGLYNQASLHTPAIYYLASELGETSPNPFRSLEFSRFDVDNALRHLRLFNARDVVALSEKLTKALDARSDVERLDRFPPYTIFRLRGEFRYVEPLTHAPVRAEPGRWRDQSYRWFTRKPLSPAHLVFSDDLRFTTRLPDPWLAPPLVPLPAGVEVREIVEPERIRIETSRPGHPLLVKVSYHPRWKAEGADGPFLVSPAMMMIIPRQAVVSLHYGRNWADALGVVVSLAALGLTALATVRRRRERRGAEPSAEGSVSDAPDGELSAGRMRWGGVVPGLVVAALFATRLPWHGDEAARKDEILDLAAKAEAAAAAGRDEAAAEYARHALRGDLPAARAARLLCMRGQGLLRLGRPLEAAHALDEILRRAPQSPEAACGLAGVAEAYERLGRLEEARATRERLEREFPQGYRPSR